MKRIALYYPTIDIPNSKWLKEAIFYFDSVASIVPEEFIDNYQFNPDIAILKSEGIYHEIIPDLIVFDPIWTNFTREINDIIESPEFQFLIQGRDIRLDSRVHISKVAASIKNPLSNKGLLRYDSPKWLLFEHSTALLYMSTLASYLAEINSRRTSDLTIPSTDLGQYRNLVFRKKMNSDGILNTQIQLDRILPSPSEEVPIDKILDFRQNHRYELLNLRNNVDEFSDKISNASDESEARRIGARFGDEIERNLIGIEEYLKNDRISTIKGSLEILIDAKRPEIWGMLVSTIPFGPIPAAIEYTIASGIRIMSFYIDKRRERAAKIKNCPYSYLFQAKQKGIINQI